MKVEAVQELLTSNGIEVNENINVAEISKSINDFATGLKESSVEKALQGVDGSEYVNKFLTENDFENVDQFNAFVKNGKATTTELQEKSTRLEQEATEYKTKYEELNTQLFTSNVNLAFAQNGVTDEQVIKDFAPIIKSNLNEDNNLNDVVKNIIERYKLVEEKPPRIGGNQGGGKTPSEMTLEQKLHYNLSKIRK